MTQLRDTMDVLIDRVRSYINDPVDAGQHFADQEIQDALDQRRWDVRYMELTVQETILPGGTIKWTHFYAPVGNWEEGSVLTDSAFNPATPDTSDSLTGLWTFTAGYQLALYITGRYFDVNAATADLLEQWLATVRKEYDINVSGLDLKRSQKFDQLVELCEYYRARSYPLIIPMVRGDMNRRTRLCRTRY